MLRTPVFWLMFLMMSMMSTGGLMVITQFKSFSKSFGITDTSTVAIFGLTLAAVPAALTFDRVTNGLTRPFFGWVSDIIGRENTMALAFIMEGVAIWLMLGFFVAFAVKMPVVPLHTWLPDAHTEAPTAGSVILAGLLLKTGAYGMLRFVLPLFPDAAREFAPVALVL